MCVRVHVCVCVRACTCVHASLRQGAWSRSESFSFTALAIINFPRPSPPPPSHSHSHPFDESVRDDDVNDEQSVNVTVQPGEGVSRKNKQQG